MTKRRDAGSRTNCRNTIRMTGKCVDGQLRDGEGPGVDEKVAFLSSPAAHPGVGAVAVRETRMAWVFFSPGTAPTS